MKNNKLSIFILSLFAVIFIGCSDSFEDEQFAAYEELPIGLTLASWEDHSDWVKLLKKADLYNALNLSMKYTCFVASNDALKGYLDAKGHKSVDDVSKEEAVALMRYHVIEGIGYEFTNFLGKLERETLSGDFLNVKSAQNGEYFVNDYAKIINKVHKPTNGRIYKLEKALNPLMTTAWDHINKERYSIFRDAVLECELSDTLKMREYAVGNDILRRYKTVFVVSDSIFKLNGISDYNQLKSIYSNVPNANGISPLYNFIAYHIVEDQLDWSTLATFHTLAKSKDKSLVTYAPTELLTVSDAKGKLLLDSHVNAVNLIDNHYDILANNGYVHEVDGLLPPVPAKTAFTNWELTNYDIFRVLPTYKKYTTWISTPVSLEYAVGIRCVTIPVSNQILTYYQRNNQNFENHDAVTIRLGNVGYAEFDVPAIPLGKYDVYIQCQRYSARGKGRLYLDDEVLTDVEFNSGSFTIKVGTRTISRQTNHVFKVTALRKGDIDIDRIYFEPVK